MLVILIGKEKVLQIKLTNELEFNEKRLKWLNVNDVKTVYCKVCICVKVSKTKVLEKQSGKSIKTSELKKICLSAGFSDQAFSALQKYSGDDEKIEWEKFFALAISMTAEVLHQLIID